jgi:putative 8-amino-7-oxononanoate synthase/2-amino-3-ketobutyrate coenzyme A ligase
MEPFDTTLLDLRRSGNFRSIPADSTRSEVIDLSSNDYLGIAARPELQAGFLKSEANRRIPLTSSASRLLAAPQQEYALLEDMLSKLYGKPALVMNSGYHANTGILSALASEPGTVILADRLVHASMIDGMVLSRARFRRFPHNDLNRLEAMIQAERAASRRIIVAVESVYSMDGDSADIEALMELRKLYPEVLLYVDEAHGVGACGPQGLGLCAATGRLDEVDILIGTFGKALASSGAFCIASAELRDYIINRARSFIFSTSLPPLCCAWTRYVIERMTGMDAERQHLAALAAALREGIASIDPAAAGTASHIQPFVTGDARRAVELSAKLLDEGFKVLPIRTPTVPPGTERLRISLSAALTTDQINRFVNSLRALI